MMNLIDDTGIRTGETLIPWNDVREVAIRTTSDGPFQDDLFWVFAARASVVELPGSLVNAQDLITMQGAMPGFDNLKVIAAMGSTTERIFRIWRAGQAPWDQVREAARFSALVARLGGKPVSEVFTRLVGAWSSGERSYHNLEHLNDCLREVDAAGAPRGTADVAELALWYHDAVYVPGASDNEERSAELLRADGRLLGLGTAAEEAAECVSATAHTSGTMHTTSTAALVADIDLAILGREPLRFMDYDYAIAEEYAAIPWSRYVFGRTRFIESMLKRPNIFQTQHFINRYEEQARENLRGLLASPRYRPRGILGWLNRAFLGGM